MRWLEQVFGSIPNTLCVNEAHPASWSHCAFWMSNLPSQYKAPLMYLCTLGHARSSLRQVVNWQSFEVLALRREITAYWSSKKVSVYVNWPSTWCRINDQHAGLLPTHRVEAKTKHINVCTAETKGSIAIQMSAPSFSMASTALKIKCCDERLKCIIASMSLMSWPSTYVVCQSRQ